MSESLITDIPAGLRSLFEASGPVIRYRLMRDVVGLDESYIPTTHAALDVARLPEVQALVAAQELDGSWGGILSGAGICTESAMLRLCELGLERCDAVRICLEKALLPSLLNPEILWEFPPEDPASARVVRDKLLHLVLRAGREHDELFKPMLEIILAEWQQFIAHAGHAHAAPPTQDGFAAVCWYPWNDDDFDRVRDVLARMVGALEKTMSAPVAPGVLGANRLCLLDKWEYLARPQDLFHMLELVARFGAARDLPVSRWLLDELEARQDADGWFRFDSGGDVLANWYFPLEKMTVEEFPVEWTFRAVLILKLLEFDL